MQYQVLVRNPSEAHFVASVIGLSNVVANGKTEAEAISNVKTVLTSQLDSAKLVTIEIDNELSTNHAARNGIKPTSRKESNPWLEMAGAFADDPTWDEFQAEIEAYRRAVDEETMP